MFIFLVLDIVLALEQAPLGRATGRRYSQLTKMMRFYNDDFDERKYWTYGCNCLMLGDRPLSQPGIGPPVDELDTVCKQYKDCVRCASERFGEQCIGERVAYKVKFRKRGEITCRDGRDTCERSLCECDALFAREHKDASDVFDQQFHLFWSDSGWTPEEQCKGSYQPAGNGNDTGSGSSQLVDQITKPKSQVKCCGGSTSPFRLYNTSRQQCCLDGAVISATSNCK